MRSIIIFILLSVLVLPACHDLDPDYAPVRLCNESSETIYVYSASYTDIQLTPEIALLNPDSMQYAINSVYVVAPHQVAYIFCTFWNDEYYEPQNSIQKGIDHQVLILKKSTIEQHSPEYLAKHNIYDKYFGMSDADVERLGFKIVYTGE